jgi:hypothetical protein
MRIPGKVAATLAALMLLLVAPAAAKKKALNECGENHCKVAVWVFNGYGAVVKKKSGLYIAGIGATKNLAFKDARERAHESAPAVAWVFSGLS